ncbi:Transcription initiation factor TFIID subunit 6 [Portunus trituberculatus]|uniref:Transcription initiation factor TFIID subunit 6 n=1 Tax=Portunus trituberculatus TaxID=210409 RepID=A0A5B7D615_PORTR|nr:Transcription initiation factor TFIID subunit 6 [Portunus trituberculatus]
MDEANTVKVERVPAIDVRQEGVKINKIYAHKTVAPVLKTLRNPPDTVNDYKAEYGYLGPQLQVAVVKARQAPPSTATTLTAPIRAITPTTTRIIQQGSMPGIGGIGSRTVVVNKPPTPGISSQQPGQKVIIMTSRPPTPSQGKNQLEAAKTVIKEKPIEVSVLEEGRKRF